MKLAIFDVDGTLTRTNEVDEICFVQAFAEAHAITGVDTDWNDIVTQPILALPFRFFRIDLGAVPNRMSWLICSVASCSC